VIGSYALAYHDTPPDLKTSAFSASPGSILSAAPVISFGLSQEIDQHLAVPENARSLKLDHCAFEQK
jgi:hypothetical protein